ncbi:MAG: hypothetical protein ACRD1E_04515, partial [Terriglobales bacterium]
MPAATADLHLAAEADFPTRWGQFRILGFELGSETALALVHGELAAAGAAPLLRIHSQCLT